MKNATLPVFDAAQFDRARIFLATRVSEMMGRKLEEGDWAQVYCAAKGIPLAGWSNTDIDVMHGHLGVEQKAISKVPSGAIKEYCGTTIMHPAGTRAVEIPLGEDDATLAARDILRQYGDLIRRRSTMVDVVNRYHHGLFSRAQAIVTLQERVLGMTRAAAAKRVPLNTAQVGEALSDPDLRTGWLIYQTNLREFLYFEEPMTPPDPDRYFARWNIRPGGGSRLGSRNLWIYDKGDRREAFLGHDHPRREDPAVLSSAGPGRSEPLPFHCPRRGCRKRAHPNVGHPEHRQPSSSCTREP